MNDLSLEQREKRCLADLVSDVQSRRRRGGQSKAVAAARAIESFGRELDSLPSLLNFLREDGWAWVAREVERRPDRSWERGLIPELRESIRSGQGFDDAQVRLDGESLRMLAVMGLAIHVPTYEGDDHLMEETTELEPIHVERLQAVFQRVLREKLAEGVSTDRARSYAAWSTFGRDDPSLVGHNDVPYPINREQLTLDALKVWEQDAGYRETQRRMREGSRRGH